MSKRIIFFLATALSVQTSLRAQVADSAKTISEVVITASKVPTKQAETGKVLTVISRETIEKSYGKSIGELLNRAGRHHHQWRH